MDTLQAKISKNGMNRLLQVRPCRLD
jgi:hypothetical protein